MNDPDTIKEIAAATGEVAKATGQAIDAVRGAGGFFAKFVDGPLTEVSGLLADHLKVFRWERQMRLCQRVEQFQRAHGISAPSRMLAPKIALPLLQAATLEDDDDLQDVWARLLVNATNEDHASQLQRSYIVILEQLTALDVAILQKIYSLSFDEIRYRGVVAGDLPAQVSIVPDHPRWEDFYDPDRSVCLSLANLDRVGCLTIEKTMNGAQVFRFVHPTLVGFELHRLCTLH